MIKYAQCSYVRRTETINKEGVLSISNLLKKDFGIYLKSRATEGEFKGGRVAVEREYFYHFPQMAAIARAEPGQSKEPAVHRGLLYGWQGPEHLYLPKHLGRNLHWELSSWFLH